MSKKKINKLTFAGLLVLRLQEVIREAGILLEKTTDIGLEFPLPRSLPDGYKPVTQETNGKGGLIVVFGFIFRLSYWFLGYLSH